MLTDRGERWSMLRLDPSLTVERKDIENFLATLEDVLMERETGR